MIYEICNSKLLLGKMRGINNWIEENNHIGNANMYEIMSCMIARNNIRLLEGKKNDELDNEVEKMISSRGKSIAEFQSDVPESKDLFNAVREGKLIANSKEEMELICKCQRVPFFINNTRRRGFDGDINHSSEIQQGKAIPNFEHDNYNEVFGMVSAYDRASDEIRKATNSVLIWTIDNSVEAIRDMVNIEPIETNQRKQSF